MLAMIGNLFGLISFVCLILTLIKMFQDKEKGGVVHGIIGIVSCGIWAFIWGWMHNAKHNHKKVMLAWTVCWIVSIALNGAAFASMAGGAGG